MSILGAAEDVGDAVAVEIDNSRADVVAFDILRYQQAHVLEEPLAVAGVDLAQEPGVGGVEQDVEMAIAVPIDDAQFAPPTAARDPGIEPQRLALLIAEHALRRQQHESPIAPRALEQGGLPADAGPLDALDAAYAEAARAYLP